MNYTSIKIPTRRNLSKLFRAEKDRVRKGPRVLKSGYHTGSPNGEPGGDVDDGVGDGHGSEPRGHDEFVAKDAEYGERRCGRPEPLYMINAAVPTAWLHAQSRN